MIKTFKNRGLKLFWEEDNARRLPVQNTKRVRQILQALDAADHPANMNVPGWRWHDLAPSRPSTYSVWVSGNYRITFAFEGQHAVDLDIEDYH